MPNPHANVALRRFRAYAETVDPRIQAVTVALVVDCDGPFPRIFDVVDADDHHLDLSTTIKLDGLAARAWDVVEAQTQLKDRADAYRVSVRPAVVAIRCEQAEL